MNELMHIPVWHFIVWTFGYAMLGAAATTWFPAGETAYQSPPKALAPSPFVSPAVTSPLKR